MKLTVSNQLRQILSQCDGMSAVDLAGKLGKNYETVRKALVAMPDAYIDRWTRTGNPHGRAYEAVWSVVEVPEDCPHPNKENPC